MDIKFEPGVPVWVVERDEDGAQREVGGYMFLAQSKEFAIVSPYISGIKDVDGTLEDYARETAEGFCAELYVFPMKDCYETLDEAMADGGTSVHLI